MSNNKNSGNCYGSEKDDILRLIEMVEDFEESHYFCDFEELDYFDCDHQDCPLKDAILGGESEHNILELIEMDALAVQQQNNQGNFAIHLACKFICSEAVILKLIELCPAAVKTMNDQGNFALHLACKYTHSDAAIMKLIELGPDAVQTPSSIGFYPFQLACMNRQSEKVVMKLIESTSADILESPEIHYRGSLLGPYYMPRARQVNR